jgi:UDP-N-acetylglucosamine 3-dehydrogenase
MLKVGVIGVGMMGKNHARVYSELKNCRLVGVCDIDKKTAKKVGEKFNVPWYTNIKELLLRVDCVSVAVPTRFHYQVVIECLKNGKDVLCEKPIALTVEEAKKMVNEAKHRGLVLGVNHIERYNPPVQKLKELIDDGKLGEIQKIVSYRLGKYPYRIIDVGVVEDLIIHDLDVSRFLVGEDVDAKIVQKIEDCFWRDNQVDYAYVVVKFKNGVKAHFNANWLLDRKLRCIIVKGTKGISMLDFRNQVLKLYPLTIYNKVRYGTYEEFKRIEESNDEMYEIPKVEKEEPLKLVIEDFLECCKTRKKPLSDGNNGLKNLEILKK